MKKDIYRSSRVGNIISAALEYFISMLVIDSYLAKLTTDIGISDSVTGILTSFVSLGFGFQLFAIFLAADGLIIGKSCYPMLASGCALKNGHYKV